MESEFLDEMNRRMINDFLDLVILMELRKRSMSGYDFVSFVHNKFHILLNSGTIYSNISTLEKDGLIKGERVLRKTVYTLTEQGKEKVNEFINAKDKILGLFLNLFISE